MGRVTRMGIGLAALIAVMWATGGLLRALGAEGETLAWLVLGASLVWIGVAAWWTLRAPPRLDDEDRARYLAFLRHARYRPPGSEDDDD